MGRSMGLPGLPGAALGAVKRSAAAPQPAEKEWTGLASFPAATQTALHSLLGSLKQINKSEVTILLLGKSGTGKSSTANSLYGEKVAAINPFQNTTAKPVHVSRTAAGITLNIIDTPSLLEGDTVSEATLSAISFELRKQPVDVVLFIDRLDVYRVDPVDRLMVDAISDHFGPSVWDNTIIGLTHGDMRSPPAGTDFDSYVKARGDGIRKAIKAAGGTAPLPVALIENSSRCRTDDDGQKVVGPSNTPWIVELMSQVCDMVTGETGVYMYDRSLQKPRNPNKKRRWLIPIIFAAQIAFKVLILDMWMEEDGARGDQYGPYEKEFVEQERARRRAEKEQRRAAAQGKEDRRRGIPTPSRLEPSAPGKVSNDMFDDDDEDDF